MPTSPIHTIHYTYASDERILGGPAFVAAVQRTLATAEPTPRPALTVNALVARVGVRLGVRPPRLTGGGRAPAVSQARAAIAYLWIEVLGRPGRPLASALGLRPAAVYAAARRGRAEGARWERLLEKE